MKFNKKIAILCLSLVMVFATTVTFAWWVGTTDVSGTEGSPTITIGEPDTDYTLEFDVTPGNGILVPRSQTALEGQVTEYEYTVDVAWDGEDAPVINGALTVSVESITLSETLPSIGSANVTAAKGETTTGAGDNVDLFIVESNGNGSIISGTAKTVTITVSMNEPLNAADLAVIQNSTITVVMNFSVAVPAA